MKEGSLQSLSRKKSQGKNKTPKEEESRHEGQETDNGTPNYCAHAVSSTYFNNGAVDIKLNHSYHRKKRN